MNRPTSEFTPQTTTTFFTDVLGLAPIARQLLAAEGIVEVADFVDFSDDMISQVTRNLRKPSGTMADTRPGAAAGARLPIPPVSISAISVERMKMAAQAVRYYNVIDRSIRLSCMGVSVIDMLDKALTALDERKSATKPAVPVFDPKQQSILQNYEAVLEHLSKEVGCRGIPLIAYLRKEAIPAAVAPPLVTNRPYSLEHGSVRQELVARATFDDPKSEDDKARILEFLEEVYAGTHVHPTLKAFKKKKDGRGAWMAIVSQYMSSERWREELKVQERIVTKRVWKGNSSYTLEDHAATHRNANSVMDHAGDEGVVDFNSPEQRRRVERILDSIECKDAQLLAAMANVRQDNGPEGMMNNFEKAVAYLIPCCPVAPNRKKQRMSAQISSLEMKKGKGNSGVEFRFYKRQEYMKLSDEQKQELKEYREAKGMSVKSDAKKNTFKKRKETNTFKRNNNPKKGRFNKANSKHFNKKVKGMVSEAVAEIMSEGTSNKDKEHKSKYNVSFMKGSKDQPSQSALTRNSISKSTTLRSTISTVLMQRLSYHAYDPEDAAVCIETLPNTEKTVEISSIHTADFETRTELDSHANMVVLGKHCRLDDDVIPPGEPGSRYATVNAFSPDHQSLEMNVVDASIAYRCPQDDTTHILHFTDALYHPSMNHNLVPPFVLREAGFTVNDIPRIHCENVSNDSHCIIGEDKSLRIPLLLHGIFSYFLTSRPSEDEFHHATPREHHFLTPTNWTWNPNTDNWGNAERHFIDGDGNLIPQHLRNADATQTFMLAPLAGFEDSDSSESTFLRDSDEDSFRTPRRTSYSPTLRTSSYSPSIRSDNEDEHMENGSTGDKENDVGSGARGHISAINGIMTNSPASLVPESKPWQVVPQVAHVTVEDHDQDWEHIDVPEQSSFANNLTARGALGHMAMSVGATSSWNDSTLFPENSSHHSGEEKERQKVTPKQKTKANMSSILGSIQNRETTGLNKSVMNNGTGLDIMTSVDRWSKVAHVSSIDGIAALTNNDGENDSDDDSYEIVYGATYDDAEYEVEESIFDDDDRKPAAKPITVDVKDEPEEPSAPKLRQMKVEDYIQLPYDPRRVAGEETNYHQTGYDIPTDARVPVWSCKPGKQFQAASWHKSTSNNHPDDASTCYDPKERKFISNYSRSLPQKLQASEERSMRQFAKEVRDDEKEKKTSKRLKRVAKANVGGDEHPTSTKKWKRDDSDTDEPDVKGPNTTYDHSSSNNYIVKDKSQSYQCKGSSSSNRKGDTKEEHDSFNHVVSSIWRRRGGRTSPCQVSSLTGASRLSPPMKNRCSKTGKSHHVGRPSHSRRTKWQNGKRSRRSRSEKMMRLSVQNRVLPSKAGSIMSLGLEKAARHFPPEKLMKAWKIDRSTAVRTIRRTSQRYDRKLNPTMKRNIRTNDKALRYNRIDNFMYMDTMFSTKDGGKSLRGNTCAQIFATDKGYIACYPMTSKAEVKKAIRLFCKEVGVPSAFICDQSGEQTSHDVTNFIGDVGSSLRLLEEGTPWANRAELVIGHLKASVRDDMRSSSSPIVLWDYCMERRARINNLTAKSMYQLRGVTPYETVHGREGDISVLATFSWYEPVYYLDHGSAFPMARECLGRYLGPSVGVGNEACSWILKANAKVIARRTIRPLNMVEVNSDIEKNKLKAYDSCIKELLGDGMKASANMEQNQPMDQDDDGDWEKVSKVPEIDEPVDSSGKSIDQQPAYDKMIKCEVKLPHNGTYARGTVVGRSVSDEGKTVGTYDENPYQNTIVYDVEFPDGEVKEYAASLIADNMYAQVDKEGFTYNLLDSIIDWDVDSSLIENKQYTYSKSGQRKPIKTTKGWKLKVLWKDGTEEWIPLKDMKESNPVETAEFAKAKGLQTQPAFKWWVSYTLKKRDAIISKVQARVRRVTHKYGIKVPRTIKQAYEFDKENGNTFWRDAVKKEMTNVGIAFQIYEDGEVIPNGFKKVTGHLIFDVKMDFTRKARYVLDGHKTEDPIISTYAGVVNRESIRISLTYAALNGLDVCAADIQNAYLQAPSSQRHYIICGPEFGLENEGKVATIVRALYGGKTAGRDFRNHLRECMAHLGFTSCLADPDVWIRPAVDDKGKPYYEYVLLYTDDALCISHKPETVLKEELGKYFGLKPESIGPPKIYLGGKMRKVTLDNGVDAWSFSSAQYVKSAVKNVEETLRKKGEKLIKRAPTPFPHGYRPEVDLSQELNPEEASYYQSLIGILRWIVELGRLDICCEVSMMATQLAMPRKGHMDAVYHIFAYLKKHHNAEMVYDPSDPMINISDFQDKDWSTTVHGSDLKEIMPGNMPEPRGQGMVMRAYVDADHASDSITRRSRTGFIVLLNAAPIYWFSKKQSTVETSSFGSEFVAMKQVTEYVRGLRYKMRMMGISVLGPTYIYGDNQSVLFNTSVPESTLKKKSQSICYHFVREGSARNEWKTGYINTKSNPADILTKPLAARRRRDLVRTLLHHLFEEVE